MNLLRGEIMVSRFINLPTIVSFDLDGVAIFARVIIFPAIDNLLSAEAKRIGRLAQLRIK